ncbi:MAG TPA: hypothetical protein EYQ86_03205 [Bacteroidetes bacterium]|nr:hypothetical protein [Bacteroidota bacterium]
MKKGFLSIYLFMSCVLFSQDMDYSRVKISLLKHSIQEISSMGLAVDHGEHKKGMFFTSDLSNKE